MPGLLDRLTKALNSPQTAMAAGLLSPTPQGSFGGGLLQGISAGNAQQQALMEQQLYEQQQQELLREQAERQRIMQSRASVSDVSKQELIRRIQEGDLEGAQAIIGGLNATKQPAPTIGSISLSGDKQLDPFFEALQKKDAEAFIKDRENASGAADAIRSSTQALELLNQGMTVGRGANALNYLGGALNTVLGVNLAPDARANAQAFGALMASQTAQIIKQFGAGTGLSDADREYALKAAGGDIEMDEDAIRRILKINAEANFATINNYNKKASEVMKKGKVPYDQTISVPRLPDFAKPETKATADEIADMILNKRKSSASGRIVR